MCIVQYFRTRRVLRGLVFSKNVFHSKIILTLSADTCTVLTLHDFFVDIGGFFSFQLNIIKTSMVWIFCKNHCVLQGRGIIENERRTIHTESTKICLKIFFFNPILGNSWFKMLKIQL